MQSLLQSVCAYGSEAMKVFLRIRFYITLLLSELERRGYFESCSHSPIVSAVASSDDSAYEIVVIQGESLEQLIEKVGPYLFTEPSSDRLVFNEDVS
jgi:hypothetical protein